MRVSYVLIDIKNATFLHLILDYQFKNLILKKIVNLISITEISRFQTYFSLLIIVICDFKIFKT